MIRNTYCDKAQPYFSNARPDVLRFVPDGVRRILEVGCGTGEFGAALKRERDVEIVGIELVAEAAESARRHLDKVITADIQQVDPPLPIHSFDCLVCNDVLEHLVDPWNTLARLRQMLKPGGWLVASIPNVRHHKVVRRLAWPGIWRYEDSGIMDRTHLRFFTRQTGRELVESAGFNIVTEQGINPSRFPVWMRVVDALSGGALGDMRYLQFVYVARLAEPLSE